MSSQARSDFLAGLSALSQATDEPIVQNANSTGAFIRRGLTVAAFNLLEAFVADRWTELATFINAGNTQFLDLPEKLQQRSIKQTIAIAQNDLRRSKLSISDLRDYARNVGTSLTAVSTTLRLSSSTWKWQGSNMSAADFSTSLRFIHVPQPFDTVRELSRRLGFRVTAPDGSNMNLEDDLAFFAQERHQSAHVASHPVTSLWLRAVPDRVLRFGICFDILASVGASKIRDGSQEFLQNDTWLSESKIGIGFVQERRRDFALVMEGRTRAAKADRNGDRLFRDACAAAGREVVVRRDITRSITDWSVPSVG